MQITVTSRIEISHLDTVDHQTTPNTCIDLPTFNISDIMTTEKIKYRAMLSGFFSGTASCIAKYALDPLSPIPNWLQEQCLIASDGDDDSVNYRCLFVSLIPRGIFLLLMLGLNLMMVASFMQVRFIFNHFHFSSALNEFKINPTVLIYHPKGMSESGTVVASALGTGTNFAVSVSTSTKYTNFFVR